MKKIEALIQPHKLEEVRAALIAIDVLGISISEVNALDPRRRVGWYRGRQHVAWFVRQMKIELVVDDEQVAACVAILRRGEPSADPKRSAILVMPIHHAIDPATGVRVAHAPPRAPRAVALRSAVGRAPNEEH
jgi:nitrogen regulatory protein P-II 1